MLSCDRPTCQTLPLSGLSVRRGRMGDAYAVQQRLGDFMVVAGVTAERAHANVKVRR